MNKITSQTVLGILGGGQLARMSSLAASTFGIQAHIYCSETTMGPAEQVSAKTTKGQLNDEEAILKFCETCDIVTLENEFIDQKILDSIESHYPDKLFPSADRR